MQPKSPPLTAWVALSGSSLVWIGGISLFMVHSLGLSNTTGWIIAASLGLSMMVAVTVILREMKCALNHADGFDPDEFAGLPLPKRRSSPATSPVRGFPNSGGF